MKYGRNKKKLGMLRGTKKKIALKAKRFWREMDTVTLTSERANPDITW